MKLLPLVLVFCAGCSSALRQTADEYADSARTVRLGMTRNEIIAQLEPTQRRLHGAERRPPEMIMKDGVSTEIFYFRSGVGGQRPEESFTPYVFRNDKLIAVGWSTLGPALDWPTSPWPLYPRTVLPPY